MKALDLFGLRVHATSYDEAATQVLEWARAGEARTVAHANVHMLMLTHEDAAFRREVNSFDLVTPDGVPLVWLLRERGVQGQQRVYGPTLMMRLLRDAAATGIPVAFYGGRTEVLTKLTARLARELPGLRVVFAKSPEFGAHPGNDEDDEALRASGAKLVFVGLGCPKQEQWIAARRDRIPAVLLAVGAAFDFHAGEVRQAPELVQRAGLEWLFRLAMEPRRLASRYARHNPRFVALVLKDLMSRRVRGKST